MASSGSRTIQLNIVGNADGATKALGDVAGHAESAGQRANKAFGSVLSSLNSTGVLGPFGEALDKIGGMFDTLAGKGKNIGAALTGLGAAGTGIGGILTAAAGPDQAAAQQLKQAIDNVGGSYDDYKEKIESAISSQEKFGTTANTTQDAIRILTTGTGDAGKALDMMGEASDLAAARHESLSQAATDLVKIYSGTGTRVLTEFGISTKGAAKASSDLTSAQKDATSADDALSKAKQKLTDLQEIQSTKTKLTLQDQFALRDAQQAVTDDTQKAADAHKKLADAQQEVTAASKGGKDALTQLADKVHGEASAASDTFTGKLKAMKAEIEDGAAKLGQKYGPALTAVSVGITGVGSVMQMFSGGAKAAQTATEGLTAATEAQTVAEDAATVSEGLALGPILLIVAAIAAVGVAAYELYQHWGEVWGFVQGVISGVWGWIKDNWPLLLGILTGPIGLAVEQIATHWDTIKNGFMGVVGWFGDRIDDIVSFFEGLPARIGRATAHAFDGLVDAFKTGVGDMIKAVPGGGIVSSVLGHLPGFAAGGNIGAGQLSIVGENGPELFLPGQSGTIVPNHALGGGGNMAVNIVVNGASDPKAVAAAVRDELIRAKRRNISGGLS